MVKSVGKLQCFLNTSVQGSKALDGYRNLFVSYLDPNNTL